MKASGVKAAPVAMRPAALLRSLIDEHAMSQHELARRCGLTQPAVGYLLREEVAFTARTAVALEAVFPGVPAEEWMALQADVDIAYARAHPQLPCAGRGRAKKTRRPPPEG